MQVITGSTPALPWVTVQVGAVPENAVKSVEREPDRMIALAPAEVRVAMT